ncbi:SGNH/GDSL hydrolase family protein [Thermoactinospora rubra]|uniref:SGNH/GDSL hydrolase family protein n=1 Tax=Thermoactinospora rubra TaxID=1088767 RepID=UPI00197D8B66|nr:SGNH/GDSL hydrolase family protein [Thermoactinospora rubra]
MMVLGDSFTVGSGPVPAWRAYATQAARLLGWQPVIAGAGGTGFVNPGRVGRTFLDSFLAELAWRPEPDVLVISGGHNDRRWSPQRVRQAAAALLWQVKARWPRATTVLVGPMWMGRPPREAYGVRDALAEVAAREGVPFLDPMRQRWTAGRTRLVLPDRIHPTAEGHKVIGRWLAEALRQVA